MKISTSKGDLDLYKGFNYSLNYSVQDLTDITKRKTSFSKDIKIPATPKNLVIFGLADNLNIEFTNFDPLEKLDCQVINDSSVVFNGFIQLDSVDFNGTEKSINIILYSNTISLIDKIKGVKLNELDWSEYDHTFQIGSGSDIFESINGKIRYYGNLVDRPSGSGYIYPIANYGGYNVTDNILSEKDIKPAVFLREYINKIFLFAGIGYESKLFDTNYFKNIVIPCNGDFKVTDEEANERFASVENLQTQSYVYPYADSGFPVFNSEELSQYNNKIQDNLNQFNLNTEQITLNNSGKFDIKFSTKIEFITEAIIGVGDVDFKRFRDYICEFRVYLNGSIFHTEEALLEQAQPFSLSNIGTNIVTNQYELSGEVSGSFNAGDVLELRYYYTSRHYRQKESSFAYNFPESRVNFTENKLSFEYSSENENIALGDAFKFSNAIPSIDADKFLKSIITAFNLYILENKDGTLTIESRDEFYNSKVTHEFDNKFDLSKAYQVEIASKEIPRYYSFKFSNEEEVYRVETSNQFNDNTFEYGSDFESSVIESTPYGFEIPNLDGAKLRMLFYNGVSDYKVNYITTNDESNVVLLSDKLNVNGYPEFSLNYGSDVYFDLYNLFYLNTINDLSNKDSKIFTGYFNINNLDINSLSLRDRIYFKGAYWRILNIENFNPESFESTKIKLFKLEGNVNYLTAESSIDNIYNNSKIFTEEFNNIFA